MTIQAIDGTKKIVKLENYHLTPVYELRRKVSSYGNIRLIIGETVLEDFDEEGHIMLLCSYPQLHDGATLYQINLPDATCMQVNVNCRYQNSFEQNMLNHTIVHLRVPACFDENFTLGCPGFIQIENPNKFTVQSFVRAMESFGHITIVQTDDGLLSMSRNELLHQDIDAVISTLKCLKDGCTVNISNQW